MSGWLHTIWFHSYAFCLKSRHVFGKESSRHRRDELPLEEQWQFSGLRLMAGMLLLVVASFGAPVLAAERIKDIATIAGMRDNQIVGYGIVIGLDGSGDQTTQTPFTVQSMINMLGNMGVALPPGTRLQLKNVAAVMVTATLPPFARPGQQIDVTVSSIGNARSLRGGTLVMTPLKGADGQIYAMAQGNLLVGGVGASGNGAAQVVNHLAAGRIPNGATVERMVPTALGQGDFITFELRQFDFSTAGRVVEAINQATHRGVAQALDGRTIQVRAPIDPTDRVAFIGRLENLLVTPEQQAARVIVNARTGSVVMNQRVSLQRMAVAHGNLTITIGTDTDVVQPQPFAGGETVVVERGQVDIDEPAVSLIEVPESASLTDVINALNALGASPTDLVSILQAMRAAGGLRAELEVI